MPTVDSTYVLAGLTVVWVVTGLAAAGHAILNKRDPRSTAIWVFIALMLPIVGAWLYWALGINRVARRARRYLGRRGRPFDADSHPREHRDVSLEHPMVGHLGNLKRVADRVARLPMLAGNAIEPLHNGEHAYPAMLEAIEQAQRSVCLASYIFDWDEVGHRFADALALASGRGVRVHLLVDGLGALRTFSRMGRRLIRTGVEVAAFFPLKFPIGRLRINLRNHRKILVIDGAVGFTGGMNISKRHLVESGDPSRVEDLHFRVDGPVVSEMQHAFVEDWALATGAELAGDAYFPPLESRGEALCRGISSGPDEDFEIIHWIVLAALAGAKHSIHIATPYFVPTWPVLAGLSMAALRGVDATLVLPSRVDIPWMRWVADAYLEPLLENGVRVYHRPPPFVHTKLLIVDRQWVLFGSANLDRRSFRLNFEFNIEAYDPVLAERLLRRLDDAVRSSTSVTLEQMRARSVWQRLRDGTAKMLSPHI